jgi:hypothetical protein
LAWAGNQKRDRGRYGQRTDAAGVDVIDAHCDGSPIDDGTVDADARIPTGGDA